MCIERSGWRQRGISLVELIVFIVIVGVGVAGLVVTMNSSVRFSADPMQSKQSLAIAESLLNEILHQPNTWCDPDDANAATAQAYAGCATNPQNVLGATPNTERRDGSGLTGEFFDNVRDYAGFAMDNIADPTGVSVIPGYRAEVVIAEVGASFGIPVDAALEITVTACRAVVPSASCAGRDAIALTGYRFRYAPRY